MSEAGLEARVAELEAEGEEMAATITRYRQRAAELEAALNDLYEQVQMDESVGICLSDRVATLQAGEVLARGERKSPGQRPGLLA